MKIEKYQYNEKMKFWHERKFQTATELIDAIQNLSSDEFLEIHDFDYDLPVYRIRQVIYSANFYLHSLGIRIRTRIKGTNGDLRLLIGKEEIT